MKRPLFDYHPTGLVLVCTEGKELIVHKGNDERPLWLHRFEAPIVGVGARDQQVLAVDEKGTIHRFEALSGTPVQSTALEIAPQAVAVGTGSELVVLGENGGVVLVGSEQFSLAVQGGCCAAVSSDGKTIAVGCSDHYVRLYRMPGRALLGEYDCEAVPQDVCAGPDGRWLVAVEDQVRLVDAEGKSGRRLTGMKGSTIRNVVLRGDAKLLGLVVGERLTVVVDYPALDTAADATYLDKEITSIAFGPHPWLGVGLTGGDGNKIDLATGAVCRTDTHPEREHHSWMLQCGAVEEVTRRAGGEPARPAAQPTGTTPTAEARPQSVKWILVALMVVLGIVVLIVVLSER